MNCPRCASPSGPDDRFCTACGMSLEQVTRPAAPMPQTMPAQTVPAQTMPAQTVPAQATMYVPAGGMSAWATPNGSLPAVARLVAGTPLQVVQSQGGWAHVQAANGWTGWVDGRYLTAVAPAGGFVPAGATASRPATAASGQEWLRYLAAAGAVLAVLGALLPWIDAGGSSENAFGTPAAFLVDFKTTAGDGFNVGFVVLALAAATAALSFVKEPWAPTAVRVGGIVLAAVGLLFVVQLFRLANFFDVSLSDLIGVGAFLVIAGGVAAAFARPAT